MSNKCCFFIYKKKYSFVGKNLLTTLKFFKKKIQLFKERHARSI